MATCILSFAQIQRSFKEPITATWKLRARKSSSETDVTDNISVIKQVVVRDVALSSFKLIFGII